MSQPGFGSDPISPYTTYVQADPTTFRAVVQKLTGAPEDTASPKLPITLPPRFSHPKPEMGPRKPAFKLHERRQAVKKLELNLSNTTTHADSAWFSPSSPFKVMASPVSTLEFLARGSPRTPLQDEEEEERAIAGKGFYLHPSPRQLTRPGLGPGSDPPELLVLFPLRSPRETDHLHHHHNNNNNSSSYTSCS